MKIFGRPPIFNGFTVPIRQPSKLPFFSVIKFEKWFLKKKYSLNLPYLYDYAKKYIKKSPEMRFLRSQSEGIFRDFYVY